MDLTDILERFCQEIIECLIKYGDLGEDQAKKLVSDSKICETSGEKELELLLHEPPYYWAMTILHSDNPEWYRNPKLWPPPKEHLNKWYRSN